MSIRAHRSWFQFSTTMLLLLVALVASLTAWTITVEKSTRPDRVEAIDMEIKELSWEKTV
ncbi:MAG TPA: hypothetical protein VGJ26_13600 [Pirellulales bacterium]|jgi:hypothetical protein